MKETRNSENNTEACSNSLLESDTVRLSAAGDVGKARTTVNHVGRMTKGMGDGSICYVTRRLRKQPTVSWSRNVRRRRSEEWKQWFYFNEIKHKRDDHDGSLKTTERKQQLNRRGREDTLEIKTDIRDVQEQ